jgi:hypothetical protein
MMMAIKDRASRYIVSFMCEETIQLPQKPNGIGVDLE